MTTKDWILLLTPIIFNGFLIYIFQTLITKKLDKIKKIDQRKKEIVDKFLQLLQDSIETVSEVEKQFRFRDDMKVILEQFTYTISTMCRYGRNMEFIINASDTLEKIRANSGFCLTMLKEYQSLGIQKSFTYPMEDQKQILEYLFKIRTLLKKLMQKTIKII